MVTSVIRELDHDRRTHSAKLPDIMNPYVLHYPLRDFLGIHLFYLLSPLWLFVHHRIFRCRFYSLVFFAFCGPI